MACLLIGSLFSASNLGFGALEDVRLIFLRTISKGKGPQLHWGKEVLGMLFGKVGKSRVNILRDKIAQSRTKY